MIKRKQQEEFGPIQDDALGTKLFLHMYGTVEKPIFELDKEERKRAMNEHLDQEKENIKEILKRGLFWASESKFKPKENLLTPLYKN